MSKLVVEGGHRLKGAIRINGAKNSALKLMVGAMLGQGTFTISDVPAITDVRTMCGVLEALGVQTCLVDNELRLQVGVLQGRVPEELAKSMRASIQVMGPLLARLGWVEVALPGGCAIGTRPLDLHLDNLIKLGARIEVTGQRIAASAECLYGTDITLRYPSVGATENLMMAAVLAKGETVIRNAAQEPEIIDIQQFLNAMGAKVQGAGSPVIRIEGVSDLGSADYKVIPDRIEAGTYLLAAAATGGQVTLENVVPEHLEALLTVLEAMGVEVYRNEDGLTVWTTNKLRSQHVETAPYPGFPTDLQPQFVVLATQAAGVSIIHESVYDRRFGYTSELKKMGAQIKVDGRQAAVVGHTPLKAAQVEAGDLRAGAALVIAALAARGETTVLGVEHIDRGYECIEMRLRQLGAKISRMEESREDALPVSVLRWGGR